MDYIADKGFATGERGIWAALVEGNWAWRKGHNAKLTVEYLDRDDDVEEDGQNRYGLLWEDTPIQYLQVRGGGRVYDGIPQSDLQNRRLLFLELHAFF